MRGLEKNLIYSITWIAPSGHCASHALQTKHSLTLLGTDLPFLISYTPTGQVLTQVSHPVHLGSTTIFTIFVLPLGYFHQKLESKIKGFRCFNGFFHVTSAGFRLWLLQLCLFASGSRLCFPCTLQWRFHPCFGVTPRIWCLLPIQLSRLLPNPAA